MYALMVWWKNVYEVSSVNQTSVLNINGLGGVKQLKV